MLIDAIYHSPPDVIRQLLERGADPRAPVDDGFPPLIAALSTLRQGPGMTPRSDVNEVLHMLLKFGADPEQRGVNDYTALHMAIAENDLASATQLLDAGAEPEARTRIDSYETPLELARASGLDRMVALLEQWKQPLRRRLRSGLMALIDVPGDGDVVGRQRDYWMRTRLWANGQPIQVQDPDSTVEGRHVECDGTVLRTRTRVSRSVLINGLFYGIEGMRIGGLRRLEMAPHMAYGAAGVARTIPPNATLTAEVIVLGADDRAPAPVTGG